jgi:hypothetical protein
LERPRLDSLGEENEEDGAHLVVVLARRGDDRSDDAMVEFDGGALGLHREKKGGEKEVATRGGKEEGG